MIFENSISGGDNIFPKMFPYLTKKYEVHVIGNELTKSVWTLYKARAKFHLFDDIAFRSSRHLICGPLKYVLRTFQSTCILLSLIKKLDGKIIIYSSSDYFPDIVPAFIAKILYPQCLWVGRIYHLIPLPWKRQNPIFYSLLSSLSQRVSFFLLKVKGNKIFVLKNTFADIQKYFPKRILHPTPIGTYHRKRKSKKILFEAVSIGTITQNRGVFDLLPIWQNVVKKLPTANLAIVGGGSSQNIQKLIHEIQRFHLEKNISSLGILSEERLLSILASCKLHLSTRIEGGASLPAIEAAAFGIPTIAYKTQAFNGKGNLGHLLVQRGNSQAFAKSILSLLKENNQYQQFSHQAKQYASSSTWEKITKEFIQTINHLH